MLWERCCTGLAEVIEAGNGLAGRVELCEHLEVGGVTPSEPVISACISARILPVNVLIRPRSGNFVYDRQEILEMIGSIRFCREAGANGIVVGALLPDGSVDRETMSRLIDEAGEMHVTFHRAFDECRNPMEALEDVISLGCDRLLTSGQAASASEGACLIRELVLRAGDRIIIMPGAGITPSDADRIAAATGAREMHGSKLF